MGGKDAMLQRVKFELLITFAGIMLEGYFMVNKVIMVPYIYFLSFKSVALREPTQVKIENLNFPPKILNFKFAIFDRRKVCYDHTNILHTLILVLRHPKVFLSANLEFLVCSENDRN